MSEENNVTGTIENMTAAFNQKDISNILSSYEHGAAVMFKPNEPITDAQTIQAMFEEAFQINPNFSYPNGHEVYIANDLALHISPWVMKGQAPDGTEVEQKGLSVAVLRKQNDGRWLMVLDNPHGQRLMNP